VRRAGFRIGESDLAVDPDSGRVLEQPGIQEQSSPATSPPPVVAPQTETTPNDHLGVTGQPEAEEVRRIVIVNLFPDPIQDVVGG
jgi:hypothetical protein